MMKKTIIALLLFVGVFSCKKSEEVVPDGPASVTLETTAVGVGGPTQPMQVFVDLSSGTQVSSSTDTWDLAFNCGTEFAVNLNASVQVMASPSIRFDINAVIDSDYLDLQQQMHSEAILAVLFAPPPYPAWFAQSGNWIDDPSGDLSLNAINNISATQSDNPVYIINRGKKADGTSRGWIKAQITAGADQYTLTYADLTGGTVVDIIIPKDPNYNCIHFSFDDGIVDVEPINTDWDIAFTTWMEKLDVGGGTLVPYFFMDYVLLNRNGVEVAVNTLASEADLLDTYMSFSSSDISGLSFSSELNVIGSDWRTIQTPQGSTPTGVKADRFYIVRDPNGRSFKLMFTAMMNASGERGYPEIAFEELN